MTEITDLWERCSECGYFLGNHRFGLSHTFCPVEVNSTGGVVNGNMEEGWRTTTFTKIVKKEELREDDDINVFSILEDV